jgi:hypothetical protein
VNFLPEKLNDVLVFFLLYYFPVYWINHLLIFRKDRYLRLLKVYPSYGGKLLMAFIIVSFVVPAVLVLIFL